ncbi:MAG: leucine-rich repeat protein, partial [Thermoguttaceae bacterium]|nr:leucine-rich repeat protein [Thermoguttaceae bacterium]
MNSTNNNTYRLIFAGALVAFAASLAPCFDLASFAVGAEREIDGVLFSEDGKTLIRYSEDKKGEVYFIPEGVETIGENAFRNSSVLSIVIPEGTTTIGDGAFADCRRLETVVFPKSLVNLGDSAFCNNDALFSIEVAEDNRVFKSNNGILCSKDGKTLIKCPDAYCFHNRDGVFAFNVFNGVERIEKKAFANCANFTLIKLPAEVKEIGVGAFDGCSQLSSIEVDRNNRHFSDRWGLIIDGMQTSEQINLTDVLYSKDGSVLIKCPAVSRLDAFIVPGFVSEIADGAFDGCSTLKSVEIREGVKKIGSGAFKGCSSLEWVSIPKSVATIEDDAFADSTPAIHAHNGSYALEYAERLGRNVAAFNDDFKLSPDTKTLLEYRGKGDVCKIPDGVEVVAASTFNPDMIKFDTEKDFARPFKTINKIVVPESARQFDDLRFSACRSLEAIDVAKGNRVFRSVDGVLYSKDGKTLLRVPPMYKRKAFTIFAGVENIGPYAFCDCSSTTSLEIPNTVKTVDPKAFVGFGTLETINVAKDNPVYRSIDGVL